MLKQMRKNTVEYRKFGLIMGLIFLLIGGWPSLKGQLAIGLLIYLGGGVLGIALFFPYILAPFYFIWMKIGDVLGWINSRIILSLIFFGLFTPLSLLLKLFKKDLLYLNLDTNTSSYWEKPIRSDHKRKMKFQF